MNCCDIDTKTAKFFHKNDCKGNIYSCNIENYLLKNKKMLLFVRNAILFLVIKILIGIAQNAEKE